MTNTTHIRDKKYTWTLCGLQYNGYKHQTIPLHAVEDLAEEDMPFMCSECMEREPLYALADCDLEDEEDQRNLSLQERIDRYLASI